MVIRKRDTEVMTMIQRGRRLQEFSLSRFSRNASILKNSQKFNKILKKTINRFVENFVHQLFSQVKLMRSIFFWFVYFTLDNIYKVRFPYKRRSSNVIPRVEEPTRRRASARQQYAHSAPKKPVLLVITLLFAFSFEVNSPLLQSLNRF